jgi:uncharacterized protein YdaU (DUF1376 family)
MQRLGDGDRARFPYLPLYVDDWLSSDTVDSFTLEQQGVYLLLLLRQWKSKDGLLPKDPATLARWTRLGPRWRKVGRPVLEQCFTLRQDGYCNTKLRRLWEQARERRNQARAAARHRWDDERQEPLPED